MVGHGGSSAGSYLADHTSPTPSHCASIVATSTLRVNIKYCTNKQCGPGRWWPLIEFKGSEVCVGRSMGLILDSSWPFAHPIPHTCTSTYWTYEEHLTSTITSHSLCLCDKMTHANYFYPLFPNADSNGITMPVNLALS